MAATVLKLVYVTSRCMVLLTSGFVFLHRSLMRGPGVFGNINLLWNITPVVAFEFEQTSGIVTMKDQQSTATILLKVRLKKYICYSIS